MLYIPFAFLSFRFYHAVPFPRHCIPRLCWLWGIETDGERVCGKLQLAFPRQLHKRCRVSPAVAWSVTSCHTDFSKCPSIFANLRFFPSTATPGQLQSCNGEEGAAVVCLTGRFSAVNLLVVYVLSGVQGYYSWNRFLLNGFFY